MFSVTPVSITIEDVFLDCFFCSVVMGLYGEFADENSGTSEAKIGGNGEINSIILKHLCF